MDLGLTLSQWRIRGLGMKLMLTAAAMWSIWKLRNELCFQGIIWRNIKALLIRIVRMARRWKKLSRERDWPRLEQFIGRLEAEATSPNGAWVGSINSRAWTNQHCTKSAEDKLNGSLKRFKRL